MNTLRLVVFGTVIAAANVAIVQANHVLPDRTFSCSSGVACLQGLSHGAPTGVAGSSISGFGVSGTTNAGTGVYGLSTSTSSGGAPAIYGYADGGSPGSVGYSTSGDGVYGIGPVSGVLGASSNETAAGVSGQNAYGDGVDGFGGTTGIGVYGTTSGSGDGVLGRARLVGGLFESTGSGAVALASIAEDANSDMLDANNTAARGAFRVDPYGNGYFTGSVYTLQTPMNDQPARDGSRMGTYSAQSTRATLEETGTAHLARGEAAVRFDPSYAKLLDFRRGYQVFLTPDGDTRGLYVAGKYEGGFIVREVEQGRASLDFDYRVVAKPYGANDARLPEIQFHTPRLSMAAEPKRPLRPSLPAVKP